MIARSVCAVWLGALFLTGCQSAPHDGGRYLRVSDAMSGRPVAQIALPTAGDCRAAVSAQPSPRSGNDQGPAPGRLSCHAEPVSGLAVRSTVRLSGALLDIETATLEQCATAAGNLARTGTGPLETVAPCAHKPTLTPDQRAIAIQWEGEARPIAALVTISQSGDSGTISAKHPDGAAQCAGTYGGGRWAIACTNGHSASGTFRALGVGRGSVGSGVDSKGRRVEFTLGAAL